MVRMNPAKCEALNISHKLSPSQSTYTVNGGTISWKPLDKIKTWEFTLIQS